MSRVELETGRYTIVNPAFGKVIGGSPTKPVVRPVQTIANVGSIREPEVVHPLFASDACSMWRFVDIVRYRAP